MDGAGAYAPWARVWRVVRRLLAGVWAAVAIFLGFMAAGISGLLFESPAYCTDGDPDPIVACFPSWGQNPVANVAIWVVGAADAIALTAPLWVPSLYRRGRGERP